jgi:hypothetical protein
MIQVLHKFDPMSSKRRHGGIVRPRLKRRRLSYKEKRPPINLALDNLDYDWRVYMDRFWNNSGIQQLIPYKLGREDECCLTNYVESGKINGIVYKNDGPRCPFDLLSKEQLQGVIDISREWSSIQP